MKNPLEQRGERYKLTVTGIKITLETKPHTRKKGGKDTETLTECGAFMLDTLIYFHIIARVPVVFLLQAYMMSQHGTSGDDSELHS